MSFYNSATNTYSWPPPYQLRRSKRARYLRLSIDPVIGLEIVLPYHASKMDALHFLNKNRQWIEKHAALLVPRPHKNQELTLPENIELRALALSWKIEHQPRFDAKRTLFQNNADTLFFYGELTDFYDHKSGIKSWLKKIAKIYLTPQLHQFAQDYQFKFSKVIFRGQKTLWGSCSVKKVINLNYKLLFLPPPLVRYVLLHELCHTIHFNHSRRFWALLGQYEPQYSQLKKELQLASQFIPKWYAISISK